MNIVYFNDLENTDGSKTKVCYIISDSLKKKMCKVIMGDQISWKRFNHAWKPIAFIAKKHWTFTLVIMGYCVLIDLLTSINANDISQNPAYSVKGYIRWCLALAFTSNEEIDKYKGKWLATTN